MQLFWTDIAANWFPAAQRLGGCHSRSYDYLHGLGGLDWHLWIHGWLESPSAGSAERREPWTDEWSPPPSLVEMGRRQFPRWVRQHWGILPAESRSHMLYRDIALSCCGAGYGQQDSTLVVDLPGGRELARCYFIPDGREDPYGKKRIETGSARHPKALHLQPFWAGAQRSGDALGLVIYRGPDLAARKSSCPKPFRDSPSGRHLARRPAADDAQGNRGKAGRSADSAVTSCCAMAVPRSASACRGIRPGGRIGTVRYSWMTATPGIASA